MNPTTIRIAAGSTREVDLGNSANVTITSQGGTAEVYIDYKPRGSNSYTSAIKASSGIGDPFSVDGTKAIKRTDLESEHVRIGAKKHNVTVIY